MGKLLDGFEDATKVATSVYISSYLSSNGKVLKSEDLINKLTKKYKCSKLEVFSCISNDDKHKLGTEQLLGLIAIKYNCSKGDILDHLSRINKELILKDHDKKYYYFESSRKVSIRLKQASKQRLDSMAKESNILMSNLISNLILNAFDEMIKKPRRRIKSKNG